MDGCFEVVAQLIVLALAVVGLAALVLRLRRGGSPSRAGDEVLEARVSRLEAELAALRHPSPATVAQPGAPGAADARGGASAAEPVPESEPRPAGTPVTMAVGGPSGTDPGVRVPPALPGAPATDPAAPEPEPPPAALPPPPRRVSLEERLGARLPVWLGSITLALAGAFLVKYSLDQGWIGPRVRVLLALAFAIALVAAGERMRRTSASIAQGLTAAGVAVLFSALLAAVHLYALITPWAGFLLMAAATAGAVALSLRHGPMVALVGLLGGLVTPHLVLATEPRPAHLFGYLLLLEGGLMALGRRRGWRGLALASLAGGFGWTLAWLAGRADARGAALFLLASAALALAAGTDAGEDRPARHWRGPHAAVSLVGLVGSLALMVVLVAREGFPTEDWVYLGVLSAGLVVLGRLAARFARLPVLAAALVAVLLAGWLLAASWGTAPALPWARYLGTVAAFGVLFAGGGYAAQWGAARPGAWAGLAAGWALVAVLLALAAGEATGRELPQGLVCLAVAALAAAGAWPVLRRRRGEARYGASAEALAGVAAVLVGLAAPGELERGGLTVGWALLVPALVEIGRRLRLEAPWRVAAVLALLVTARLVALPALHVPSAGWPLFNRLLLDFGLPLVAFAVAAWRAAGTATGGEVTGLLRFGRALGWGAALFAFLLAGHLVRHAFGTPVWEPVAGPFHPGSWMESGYGEWGALTGGWLLLALALGGWGRRRAAAGLGSVATSAAAAATLATVALVALGPVLAENPLWTHRPVGATPIANLLLVAYGLPALLLGAHAFSWSRAGGRVVARTAGTAALALVFLLVTLEVRQAFHGTFLDAGAAGHGEQYAYSAAWVLLGTALLVAGILRRRGGRPLRFAALAVTTVAVAKVFLYDTAHLSDLYRVLSFLGLGLSLLLLAWLYQRFVFGDPERGAAPPPSLAAPGDG